MLNIQIDNPELEECLEQLYGVNKQLIAQDFAGFVLQNRILAYPLLR